jgi:predicted O-methyltransferase YrrM
MVMTLTIDAGIAEIDLSSFLKYIDWAPECGYFPQEPGVNHHKLLAYLVKQLPANSLVADLGTYLGSSALALASNPKVRVITIDKLCQLEQDKQTCRDLPNVQVVTADCLKCIDLYINASLILLDIAPHDGAQERDLLLELRRRDYKGVVVCDDSELTNSMRSFWESVEQKKINATKYGHWSGTGIVIFAPNVIDVTMT